jgi:tRNA 2-thiouridine synthesizing protein D
MKMAFQVMTTPYTHQDVDTTMNLAESALRKGHEVSIFLFCDAVLAANSQVKPIKMDRNIPEKLKQLGDQGARIQICGLCYQYRGLDASQTIPGSSMSGLPELARLIAECDRFVSLTG